MKLQRLMPVLLVALIAGGSPAAASETTGTGVGSGSGGGLALQVAPTYTFRAFKAPVTVHSVEQRGKAIQIELVDTNQRSIIVEFGGDRAPGTLLEIFKETPRDEIVLKNTSKATEGTTVEKGGTDEKRVLEYLQDWRTSPAASGTPVASKKPATSAVQGNDARRKIVDEVLDTLKKRHPTYKPAVRPQF